MSSSQWIASSGIALQEPSARVTLSLPAQLLRDLDSMAVSRGFANRSQAMADLIATGLTRIAQQERSDQIMAGTLSITYDRRHGRCQYALAEWQHKHLQEVVASLKVQLENDHTLEVMLMQGPAGLLRVIADEMLTQKGVVAGNLDLTTSVMPPLHGRKLDANPAGNLHRNGKS